MRADSDPFAGHLALMATFAGATGAAAAALRRRGRFAVPEPRDVALLGVAAFKLSRLVTRERVTRPLRAPFVELGDAPDGSEDEADPRNGSVRQAVGELLTCPFCASVWAAAGLTVAYAAAPQATRAAASALASMAVADASQYALAGVQRLEG